MPYSLTRRRKTRVASEKINAAEDRLLDGYCFKCKTKKEMANPTETRTKNGKLAVTGSCVTCGTKMFKIGVSVSGEAPPPSPQALDPLLSLPM